MELTQSQAAALETILGAVESGDSRLLSLAGSAGTGKTTLIKGIWEKLLADGVDVVVATPTNKAAQVLESKGIKPAKTFYKTFFILEGEAADPLKKKKEAKDKKMLRFLSCKDVVSECVAQGMSADRARERLEAAGKKLHCQVLIIDEASMLARRRIREMLQMCDMLILVGDHHQLPPVGDREFPEGYFAQLQHTATLTEIMRQAEGSLILALADELRRNGPAVERMLKHFEPQESFATLIKDGFQAIAFTNKERQRINLVSRKILGFTSSTPCSGDRVLVTNNYDSDLVNGTVLDVVDFLWDGGSYKATLVINMGGELVELPVSMRAFAKDQVSSVRDEIEAVLPDVSPDEEEEDLLELTYSYCLTAHKAQGSEWPGVIVFDQRSLIRKIQENDLNAGIPPDEYVRRWTYTAATRARKTLHFAPPWFAKSY
jgi:exodeoxyribonuclease V